MASRDKKDLVFKLATAFDFSLKKWKEIYSNEPVPFLVCTYRSPEEQDELYKIGRTIKGKKITNAKGGQSKHNTNPSTAFDIAFLTFDKKLDWNPKLFKKSSSSPADVPMINKMVSSERTTVIVVLSEL